MTTFTFILRACPEPAKAAIALLLGKAFSLKDSTCASIADSAPIVLLPDLSAEEAAVMQVTLSGFTRAGATVDFTTRVPDELPKIDWPRRPQVFKRDISEHVADFTQPVLVQGSQTTLLALLQASFGDTAAGQQSGANRALNSPTANPVATPPVAGKAANEFRGIQLPEITPFGGIPALPPPNPQRSPTPGPMRAMTPQNTPSETTDAVSRLNELFPDEESSGFLPNNQDITSILNKLLPDEDGGGATTPSSTTSGRRAAVTSNLGSGGHQIVSGYAVFLAKIADEGRRQKAVPLIAELAKISNDEADALSKKVIIPVLNGASQADAEAAKQKFAKIGILARVKGPE